MGNEPTECAVCGSARVAWRRCKLVCGDCGTIQMSCSDLALDDGHTRGVARRAFMGALVALLAQPLVGRAESPAWSPAARDPITVFAASDLAQPFAEIAPLFEKARGIPVRLVFGASGNLALQIEHGAPADIFFAANVAFVDGLRTKGLIVESSQRVYARGHLILATADRTRLSLASLADLRRSEFARIAIANPETAPYGKAARESLERVGLFDAVRAKLVFGENIRHTLQLVQTGAVDAGLLSATATHESGIRSISVADSLHAPIEQAAAIVAASTRQRDALAFLAFVMGAEGRVVMTRYGLTVPDAP